MRVKECNRAVEPVISALILVVITVFAFSLAYGAYSSWTSTQRGNSMLYMQERLVVEAARFNSTANTANLFLFNVGEADITIDKIMINGTYVEITSSDLSLVPGMGKWVNVSYSQFSSGNIYALRIVSQRGLVAETFEKI